MPIARPWTAMATPMPRPRRPKSSTKTSSIKTAAPAPCVAPLPSCPCWGKADNIVFQFTHIGTSAKVTSRSLPGDFPSIAATSKDTISCAWYVRPDGGHMAEILCSGIGEACHFNFPACGDSQRNLTHPEMLACKRDIKVAAQKLG